MGKRKKEHITNYVIKSSCNGEVKGKICEQTNHRTNCMRTLGENYMNEGANLNDIFIWLA